MQKGAPCYSVLYSPMGQPLVEAVMATLRASNDPPLPPALVRGFASPAEVRWQSELSVHPCMHGGLMAMGQAWATHPSATHLLVEFSRALRPKGYRHAHVCMLQRAACDACCRT